jgi:3-hydroxyisobutyrate dehydrogenase-like beta-hydroxyacid dehydrogenase
MSTTEPVVGFVGLGAMGSRMASRILASGRQLVAYNRTPARATQLRSKGAEIVATPAEVAERADIVCGCLLDGTAVDDVYTGKDGLVGASRPGQIFAEHGTFTPELARSLELALRVKGAAFLDAPITGGPEAASAGQLTMMVGGSPDALAEASPVLSFYADRIRHLGPTGSGLELKLVNQLLVSCNVAATAEAAAMLMRLDLPIDVAAEVLTAGWASSAMLERGLARIQRGLLDESEATIGGLVEPQDLAARLAADVGLTLSILPAAAKLFQDACKEGMGPMDLAALFRIVEVLGTST